MPGTSDMGMPLLQIRVGAGWAEAVTRSLADHSAASLIKLVHASPRLLCFRHRAQGLPNNAPHFPNEGNLRPKPPSW